MATILRLRSGQALKLFVRLRGGGQAQLLPEQESLEEKLKTTLDEVMSRYSFSTEADLKEGKKGPWSNCVAP